jgi:hypothetical protein
LLDFAELAAWRAKRTPHLTVIANANQRRSDVRFPPKADIDRRLPYVRFVPEADIRLIAVVGIELRELDNFSGPHSVTIRWTPQ